MSSTRSDAPAPGFGENKLFQTEGALFMARLRTVSLGTDGDIARPASNS